MGQGGPGMPQPGMQMGQPGMGQPGMGMPPGQGQFYWVQLSSQKQIPTFSGNFFPPSFWLILWSHRDHMITTFLVLVQIIPLNYYKNATHN